MEGRSTGVILQARVAVNKMCVFIKDDSSLVRAEGYDGVGITLRNGDEFVV